MKRSKRAVIFTGVLFLGCIGSARPGWTGDIQKAEAPQGAPAPVPAGPNQTERVFPGLPYAAVLEQVVGTLQEKGLIDHPHGKAMIDKEKGKITTPTYRYFRITSARLPLTESDYRDSYEVTLSLSPPIKVVIHRKFEIYDPEKKAWVQGDPDREEVGFSPEDLMGALEAKLSAALSASASHAPEPKGNDKPTEK